MTQTQVLAAHLENHGDLIADPDTPSEHLIATFNVDAFETLWEEKGWVLVNRAGEPVETLEEADPASVDNATAVSVDRAALRKERVQKFSRGKRSSRSSTSSSNSSTEKTGA